MQYNFKFFILSRDWCGVLKIMHVWQPRNQECSCWWLPPVCCTINIKIYGMCWKMMSSNLNHRCCVVEGIMSVLWIPLGGSQEPVGTERNLTFFYTVRRKHHNIPATFSHSTHPQSRVTNRSMSRRKQGNKGAYLSIPSLLQPRRRWCIITANILTQVSFSPFPVSVSQSVEQLDMFHLWQVSRVWLPVFDNLCYTTSTILLLGAIEPDKEAPYWAGLLGLCFSADTVTAIGIEVYIERQAGIPCFSLPLPLSLSAHLSLFYKGSVRVKWDLKYTVKWL